MARDLPLVSVGVHGPPSNAVGEPAYAMPSAAGLTRRCVAMQERQRKSGGHFRGCPAQGGRAYPRVPRARRPRAAHHPCAADPVQPVGTPVRFLRVQLCSSTASQRRQRASLRRFGNFSRRNRPTSPHDRGPRPSNRAGLKGKGGNPNYPRERSPSRSCDLCLRALPERRTSLVEGSHAIAEFLRNPKRPVGRRGPGRAVA